MWGINYRINQVLPGLPGQGVSGKRSDKFSHQKQYSSKSQIRYHQQTPPRETKSKQSIISIKSVVVNQHIRIKQTINPLFRKQRKWRLSALSSKQNYSVSLISNSKKTKPDVQNVCATITLFKGHMDIFVIFASTTTSTWSYRNNEYLEIITFDISSSLISLNFVTVNNNQIT